MTKGNASFTRVLNIIYYCLEMTALLFFIMMITMTVLQVAARFILPISMPWTEEGARFLLIAVTFLGASVVAKNQAHIRIDILVNRIPSTIAPYIWLLGAFISLLFLIPLNVGIYLLILQSWDTPTASIGFLNWGHVYIAPLVGIFFVTIAVIVQSINKFIIKEG